MTTPTASSTRARLDWVDVVKATSVVLVVLMHVTQTLDFAVGDAIVSQAWTNLMVFIEPLRMPVFFVTSGLLASSAVRRDWSFTKSRTIGMLYLFLLWHTLFTLFAVAIDLLRSGSIDGGAATAFWQWAAQIVLTPGGYWYFAALALYFVIARLTRNQNPWAVLAVAAALNLAQPLTGQLINGALAPIGVPNMFTSVVLNAVYFLAGVHLVSFLKAYAQRDDTRMLMATATIAVVGSAARLLSPELAQLSFLPIAAAWTLTAILVAVRASRWEPVRAFGAYVGPRTLPIFVIQFLVLEVLYNVLPRGEGTWLAGSPLLQVLYPVVVTLAIIVLSLRVYDQAMRHRTSRLLFSAPKSWTAAPAGAGRPAAEPVRTPIALSPTSTGPVPVVA